MLAVNKPLHAFLTENSPDQNNQAWPRLCCAHRTRLSSRERDRSILTIGSHRFRLSAKGTAEKQMLLLLLGIRWVPVFITAPNSDGFHLVLKNLCKATEEADNVNKQRRGPYTQMGHMWLKVRDLRLSVDIVYVQMYIRYELCSTHPLCHLHLLYSSHNPQTWTENCGIFHCRRLTLHQTTSKRRKKKSNYDTSNKYT